MGRKQSEIKLNKIRLSNTDITKKRNNRRNNYKNNDSQVTLSYMRIFVLRLIL